MRLAVRVTTPIACTAALLLYAGSGGSLHAQGRAPAWCNTPTGPGHAGECKPSGSRTIIIEREVEIVHQLGPPQIIWRLPSAEGGTSSNMAPIANPGMQSALGAQSRTPDMLLSRTRRALRDGDCEASFALLDAAQRQNPSQRERADIERTLQQAREKCPFKFEKTPNPSIVLEVDGISDEMYKRLFDPNRKDLEGVRQEMLKLFMAQSTARGELAQLKEQSVEGTKLREAEKKLKAAQMAVEKKAKDNEPIIMKVERR